MAKADPSQEALDELLREKLRKIIRENMPTAQPHEVERTAEAILRGLEEFVEDLGDGVDIVV